MKYNDGGFSGPLRYRVAMISLPLVTQRLSEQGCSISANAQIAKIVEMVWFNAATMSSNDVEPSGMKSKNNAKICSVSVLPLII